MLFAINKKRYSEGAGCGVPGEEPEGCSEEAPEESPDVLPEEESDDALGGELPEDAPCCFDFPCILISAPTHRQSGIIIWNGMA